MSTDTKQYNLKKMEIVEQILSEIILNAEAILMQKCRYHEQMDCLTGDVDEAKKQNENDRETKCISTVPTIHISLVENYSSEDEDLDEMNTSNNKRPLNAKEIKADNKI